ncbi:MAG: DUF3021 domain-containing protein [Clostridia bacterium]|nr:DUF3021 domain-containing protein [Clostridia bacterium]
MNKYFKIYLHRGAIFGGFGPIIAGIVYLILDLTGVESMITGRQMLLVIISTYILAFIHAGSSVFNQIEHWPIAKSILFHFTSLYLAYTVCYLMNSWIPFSLTVFLIYTVVFILAYGIIWLTVVLTTKKINTKLNEGLNK